MKGDKYVGLNWGAFIVPVLRSLENRSCYESRIRVTNPFPSVCLILAVPQTGQSSSQGKKSPIPHPFPVLSSPTQSKL